MNEEKRKKKEKRKEVREKERRNERSDTGERKRKKSTVREMREVIKNYFFYKIWATMRSQMRAHCSKMTNFLGYSMFEGAAFCSFRC